MQFTQIFMVEAQLQNFDQILLNAQTPLLVVFHSEDCGPSYLFNRVLEQIGQHMPDLEIVKLDCEEHPHLATRYEVHALPALVLFNQGQLIDHIEEEQTAKLISPEALIERLQDSLHRSSNESSINLNPFS